jgi:hypothetical protein
LLRQASTRESETVRTQSSQKKAVIMITSIMGVIVIGMVVTWARSFYGSRQCYWEGEKHLQNKEMIRAVTFFDRSIHWYTPFNPYIEKAAKRLWEIGMDAEEKGDVRLALIAFRTIRHGFYSVRSFYVPGKDWIARCEAKIDKLVAMEERQEVSAAEVSRDQAVPGPDIFWSIVVVGGFLGWVGSVAAFILSAFKPREECALRHFPSLAWIGIALVFFALWIVGMMRA